MRTNPIFVVLVLKALSLSKPCSHHGCMVHGEVSNGMFVVQLALRTPRGWNANLGGEQHWNVQVKRKR